MGRKKRIEIKHKQKERRRKRRLKLKGKGRNPDEYFYDGTYVGKPIK